MGDTYILDDSKDAILKELRELYNAIITEISNIQCDNET